LASVLCAQQWLDLASKLSSSDASAIEQQLQSHPEDLNKREILITYYTLKGIKSKRLEQSLWLTKNHPEAVGDCPYAQIAEQDSPFDSMAAFEEAKALWLTYADSRTTDPRVLMSAGKFIWQFDPNLSERLLLQGRQLEPDNREWVLALTDLYGKGIFTDGRFRPQTPPSPARHNFALRARLVLKASKDPLIVGLAGLRAKQGMVRGDRPLSDFGRALPGTLVKWVKAEYPESAKRAGVRDVVQLRILVGTSGRVIVVRPEDGPVELQFAAAEAVKPWVYKPFELNGSPVETWKEVAINFQ
jgi:hypothetical protein